MSVSLSGAAVGMFWCRGLIFGAHHVPPRPRPFSVRKKPLKGMCGNLPRAAIVLLLPSHTIPHLVVSSPSDIAVRPPVPPRTSPHLPFRPRLPCRSHLPLYSTQSQSTPALSLIAAAQGQIYTDAFGHASRPIPVPISPFSSSPSPLRSPLLPLIYVLAGPFVIECVGGGEGGEGGRVGQREREARVAWPAMRLFFFSSR